MAEKNNYPVRVLDMTNLFSKELLIYSLFDIKFKKPVRLIFWVYLFITFAIWGFPMGYLFIVKLHTLNIWTAALIFGPPVGLATIMSKPIWGGKSFYDWTKTQILYLGSPKYYCDHKPAKKEHTYKIDNSIVVSRRSDIEYLSKLK